MMRFLCLISLLPILAFADSPSPETLSEAQFKAKYHLWVAYLYEHPKILEMSSSHAYTNCEKFSDIVKLGMPALPYIINEIKAESDMSLFLGEAILQITRWNKADFNLGSLQTLNEQLIQRFYTEQRSKGEQGAAANP